MRGMENEWQKSIRSLSKVEIITAKLLPKILIIRHSTMEGETWQNEQYFRICTAY